MKVKPRKIETAICPYCGKYVKFRLGWKGVAQVTRKGIITYKELFAICKECDCEIYVPAVNNINAYRREKAYTEKIPQPIQIPITADELAKRIEEQLKMKPSEKTERGKEILKEIFKGEEQNG